MQRQQVDVAFDIFDREEMAAGIEHGSPISHARLVPHDHGRNVARIRHCQLQQALQPVKYALRRTAANRYAFARYSEQILLRPERRIYGKPYRPARVSIRGDGRPYAERPCKVFGEKFRGGPQRFGSYDNRSRGDRKRTFPFGDGERAGNDADTGIPGRKAQQRRQKHRNIQFHGFREHLKRGWQVPDFFFTCQPRVIR